MEPKVRDLMTNNAIFTPGPNATIRLRCVSTGEIRVERIRLDWWEDELFREGYEALRADEGFKLLSDLDLPKITAELELWE